MEDFETTDTQPGISKDFLHAQLAPAGFHSRRMVVTDSQTTRGISGGSGGSVAESEDSADVLATKRFHRGVGGHLRRFEMHGDGLVAPRIFQLVAPIGDVNKLHAQLVRGIFKTAGLVTQFRRKSSNRLGGFVICDAFSMPGSNKAISACDGIFTSGFWAPMETNWSRVGSAQQYQGSLRNGTPAWIVRVD